jgi:hypothetical protein
LTINLLGVIIYPTVPVKDSKITNNPIEGYHYSVHAPDALLDLLNYPPNKFDLEKTNTLIFHTLRHSPDRKITFFENWLWWVAGCFSQSFQRTQDAEKLIRGGAALCGEAAMVMNSIAERFGHRTRLIGLGGHVVAEVETELGWRVADPDYGVTYNVDLETLESEKGMDIIQSKLLKNGYDPEIIKKYILLFQSSDDNIYYNSSIALSPRLYKIEKISDYMKWLIPLLFWIITIGLSQRKAIST